MVITDAIIYDSIVKDIYSKCTAISRHWRRYTNCSSTRGASSQCSIARHRSSAPHVIRWCTSTAQFLLNQDKNIIILTAGKSNATVITNKTDYVPKIESLLEDAAYRSITSDSTTYLEETAKTKINCTPLDNNIKKKMTQTEKFSRRPKFYGLPKIHQADVPLRPVVGSIGSPSQDLTRYLLSTLPTA